MLNYPMPGNPLVYLDIKIGDESVGRIVIELRKDVVPRTADNFRLLCTGEKGIGKLGKPLHYKGIKFHKVERLFMCQSGDIVKNDGTSGESIFGPVFDDENLDLLKHDEGAVSMANFGEKNTNNSQFFITSIACPQLDGTNVVVGYVLRGFGIIAEMEKYTSDDGITNKEIIIEDCGEIKDGDNWGFIKLDGTNDIYPPFPNDWESSYEIDQIDEMLKILNEIKYSGNLFYKQKSYIKSSQKYQKAQRYYYFFLNRIHTNDLKCLLDEFNSINLINLAAVELKLKNYLNAKLACNETLKYDPQNTKALYRRGCAEIELKNYQEALNDFKRLHQLAPDKKFFLKEFNRAKSFLMDYRRQEKKTFMKMFK